MLDLENETAVALEQTLLGGLLFAPDKAPAVAEILPATGAFCDQFHQSVFDRICELQTKGEAVSVIRLAPFFDGQMVGDVPARSYLASLYGHADAAPGQLLDYAKSVAVEASKRQLRDACRFALTAVANGESPAQAGRALVEDVDAAMRIVEDTKRGTKSFGVAVREAIDDMLNPQESRRAPTGLTTLDNKLGGLHCGEFGILAGRPGMGKSTMALQMAINAATRGVGVAVFSMEMQAKELGFRGLSSLTYGKSKIPYTSIRDGKLSDASREMVIRAGQEWQRLPLEIDDERGLTLAQIEARARRIRRQMATNGVDLRLLIVDHLGLIRVSDRYRGNRVNEVSEISTGLATIASRLDVAVLALSQLSRAVEQRENKRPMLSDLRDSGTLEQDAHVVMFAFREAYYMERDKPTPDKDLEHKIRLQACSNEAELAIAKNRNGPCDTLTLFCDVACNRVDELEGARQ